MRACFFTHTYTYIKIKCPPILTAAMCTRTLEHMHAHRRNGSRTHTKVRLSLYRSHYKLIVDEMSFDMYILHCLPDTPPIHLLSLSHAHQNVSWNCDRQFTLYARRTEWCCCLNKSGVCAHVRCVRVCASTMKRCAAVAAIAVSVCERIVLETSRLRVPQVIGGEMRLLELGRCYVAFEETYTIVADVFCSLYAVAKLQVKLFDGNMNKENGIVQLLR